MELTHEQEAAIKAVDEWYKGSSDQVFYLAGYAGTGKTSLARRFAGDVSGQTMFMAFTGKAAQVMRTRGGCDGATTIHRAIYQARDKSRKKLRELELKLVVEKGKEFAWDRTNILRDIVDEKRRLSQPAFVLDPDSAVKDAALVVVDECSMVDERIASDLMSYGTKILVLGDPGQLPPVRGRGFFTSRKPDHMLETIHRQAQDDPIIRLATAVRQGEKLTHGQYGESYVGPRSEAQHERVMLADQCIVGLNTTRNRGNVAFRDKLGRASWEPEHGDKLICLRNDHEVGVMNGSMWIVNESSYDPDEEDGPLTPISLDLVSCDDARDVSLTACAGYFRQDDMTPFPYWEKRDVQEFDWGYVVTCHKAQGSQWSSVAVVDESATFRRDRNKWLYTAITRAQDKVEVFQ